MSKQGPKSDLVEFWNSQVACPFCDGHGSIGKVTAQVLKQLMEKAVQ